MATSITFTDSTGSATLNNGMPVPADRFGEWTPEIVEVGSRRVGLGTGTTHQFRHRTDYVVSFLLEYIPSSKVDEALRLKAHLLGGGTCTVNTGDASSNSYTCGLRPGTVPEIRLMDRRQFEYVMRLELRNTSAAPLLCDY